MYIETPCICIHIPLAKIMEDTHLADINLGFFYLAVNKLITDKTQNIFISSSCCAISTDIPDPVLPPLPIVHYFRQVFRATSCISTELLYVGSSWSSCFACPCEGVHRSTSLMSSPLLLQHCPTCLILIVFVMGGSGCTAAALWVAASRTCSILLATFLCCVVAIKLFLHTFS